MFSYGWLVWCMWILVRMAGMAGYTTVLNWLETAATRAICCTRALMRSSLTVQHTLSVAQFYRFGGFCMCLVVMSYVGWLGAWGVLVISIVRVAGDSPGPSSL